MDMNDSASSAIQMNKSFWLFIFTVTILALGTFSLVQTRRLQAREDQIDTLLQLNNGYASLLNEVFSGQAVGPDLMQRLSGDFEVEPFEGEGGYQGYLLSPRQAPLATVPQSRVLEIQLSPEGHLHRVGVYKP
ncbi:MAG: hypothetical protein D6722_07945 [Bacteroidetes bacterium]|nr:MAG: hypothetical protein D6722_07945 [Bacteroidota bacterium]